MRKRANEVKIRMTDDEYERYRLLLKKSGLNGNEYGLRSLLEKEIFTMPEAKDILRILKGIGNNLNQLTRLANSGRLLPTEINSALDRQVEDLWQLLKRCGKVKI